MTCRNGGSCHKPGREYTYAFGRRRTWLCDGCLASLVALGMSFTATSADTRPEWLLRGIRGRDETGAVA